MTQALAPFCAGVLWSAFMDTEHPHNWPIGSYLAWNVFGILSAMSFLGSCWIGHVVPDIAVQSDERQSGSHDDRMRL
jgi:hypothetical protein